MLFGRSLNLGVVTLMSASLLLAQGCVTHDIVQADNRTHLPHQVNNAHHAAGAIVAEEDDDSTIDLMLGGVTAVAVVVGYPIIQLANAIERANGDTPVKAAHEMENPHFPDIRRRGIIDLATRYNFALKPPYSTRYEEIARTDPDPLVRATAIRALNLCRDKNAVPIFIAALDDSHKLIRLEACKALGHVPDVRAIPGLLRRLDGHVDEMIDGHLQEVDEDPDVRIAAASALRQYHQLDVATALVGYLNAQNFAVAWQSHRSLEKITGADWQYDESAWLKYLSGPNTPFKGGA